MDKLVLDDQMGGKVKEEMELEEYSKVDFPKILINEDNQVLTPASVM